MYMVPEVKGLNALKLYHRNNDEKMIVLRHDDVACGHRFGKMSHDDMAWNVPNVWVTRLDRKSGSRSNW